MTTLATAPSLGPRPRSYAPVPWHEDHPQRRALEELLDPDHLARRIDQAVAQLDRQALDALYGRTGSLPYDPAYLLRAVLFEVQRGQHSPAAWWRDSRELGPIRWLLRGLTPSRSCWYAFRERLGPVLEVLNRQVLHQAVAEELTPASRGALDGTLVAANASRHRLVNEATLTKRVAQLAAAVIAVVVTAAATPAACPSGRPVAAAAVPPSAATTPLPPVVAAAAVPPSASHDAAAARRGSGGRAAAVTSAGSRVASHDPDRPTAATATSATGPSSTGNPAPTQPGQAGGQTHAARQDRHQSVGPRGGLGTRQTGCLPAVV